MSKNVQPLPFSPIAWIVPAAACGLVMAAVISYARSGESQAAAGSPYYGKAVREALDGLKNAGAAASPAGARPSLPPGAAPEDHYWCEQCNAYHKRQPAAGAQPAAAPNQPEGAIPPLSPGLSPDDHYWCVNCKTYHAKSAQAKPAAWGGVPYRLPVAPAKDH